jgi:hypothetical protein
MSARRLGIFLCAMTICLWIVGSPVAAEIGTIDDVPAATLLLPYFEVNLGSPNGITTLFSINNASASAAVAHVVFWTDESIPTLDFDIYLTGYDVQTINIRDIFNGNLPVTADAGNDPKDTISPQGSLSQDISFPGSTGPCGSPSTVYSNPALSSTLINHLRRAHTGLSSPVFGNKCSGAFYGDNIARGYITMDSTTTCNLSIATDPGYFTSFVDHRNILWGDYFYVNPEESFAGGETLVHIESCNAPSVGNGAGQCPYVTGDYTFYGRYSGSTDQREPLATTFATRFAIGGGFDGGTDLVVWRDSKVNNPAAFNCGSNAGWFPLAQSDVVAFDEQEHPTNLCFQGDNVSPATGGTETCFPLEAERVHVEGGNLIAADMNPPTPFGWLYLNLNHSILGDPFPGVAQAWVTTLLSAEGRYEVGYDAIQLDNASTAVPGGFVLIQ